MITEVDQATKTACMTVDGFEHLGVITVRPRRVKDELTISRLTDHYLFGDVQGQSIADIQVSNQTRYRASTYAIAATVIVDPLGLVDRLLESDDPKDVSARVNVDVNGKSTPMDLSFFDSFLRDYSTWSDGLVAEAREKKSGTEIGGSGTASASSSETDTTSSPQTPGG